MVEAMSLEELAAAQLERFPLAAERAQSKVLRFRLQSNVEGLLGAAQKAKPSRKAEWVHRAASSWSAAIEHLAACRKGCCHCCHIPVVAFSSEAGILARVTGRTLHEPAVEDSILVRDLLSDRIPMEFKLPSFDRHDGMPCPFLRDGACTVYEHRPLICRTHFNLDDDDLLCRVIPGKPGMVPYADANAILAASLTILIDDRIADIRDYFPASQDKDGF